MENEQIDEFILHMTSNLQFLLALTLPEFKLEGLRRDADSIISFLEGAFKDAD